MNKSNFVLSSVTSVSNNEMRTVVGIPPSLRILNDDCEIWACGDRNRNINIFKHNPATNTYSRIASFPAHEGAISCLSFLPPCDWFPEGALLSASHDKTISAWPLTITSNDVQPLVTLIGHDNEVCFVTGTSDGKIVSSSWDSTARIWSQGAQPIILRHEQYAIWSVCPVPGGYVTLGADKTMRVWNEQGVCQQKYENVHEDVLRASRFFIDCSKLVTVSNDGHLKEWLYDSDNYSLEQIGDIVVSDQYLYSLSYVDEDTYVVSGEDRCVYVVSSETKSTIEVLPLPGVVWSIDVLSNGDIVTASTDGIVRTFTRDSTRRCSADIEQAYFAGLEAVTFNNPAFQQLNPLDLPNYDDFRQNPGTPGQAHLVRYGEEMAVCTWSTGYNRWLIIGIVTKNKGSQKEKVYAPDGTAYDFMITVNMEDGRNLPLYLNYDSNPYSVARKFLIDNNLPSYFLDQIATFVYNSLKPYQLQLSDQPAPGESSFFPLTTPHFIESIDTTPIINMLRRKHSEMTELQLQLLESQPNIEWFDYVYSLVTTWPVTESWPIIDILRSRVLYTNATDFISTSRLVQLVNHFQKQPNLGDSQILVLMRLIANMFKNFINEAMTSIRIIPLLKSYVSQFSSFTPRTQIAYSTAVMNLSVYIARDLTVAPEVAELMIDILTAPRIDDEAMRRILYTCGTIAALSPLAKDKLKNRPDLFINIKESMPSEPVNEVLTPLISLIS